MNDKSPIDTIYANPLAEIGRFSFDDKVADVFPDMIKRSVPGYMNILNMIGDITARYAQPNSCCYDLGCSLGAATLSLRHNIAVDNCRIIGIDNSEAMIKRCQTNIDGDHSNISVSLKCSDIESTVIENASVVVLNFTLQFIAPSQRQAIIQRIYDGLLPGGILLISEKIIFEDKPHQQLMTELYHNFKRTNGYSDLEIAQKRSALEDVLRPETIQQHTSRLKNAGFSSADVWFQSMTFASLIAIKA